MKKIIKTTILVILIILLGVLMSELIHFVGLEPFFNKIIK